MKLICVILLLVTSSIFSQSELEIYSFNDAEKYGGPAKLIKTIQEDYKPTNEYISGDSLSAAWYNDFYPKFKKYITDKDLYKGAKFKVWMELECAADGTIEKLLFRLITNDSEMDDKVFKEALKEFFSTYKYSLKLKGKYRQCGSFRFGEKL